MWKKMMLMMRKGSSSTGPQADIYIQIDRLPRPSSAHILCFLSSAAISTISPGPFLDAAHRHDTRWVSDNNSGLDQKTMPVMLLIHSVPFKAGRQKHARRKLESNV